MTLPVNRTIETMTIITTIMMITLMPVTFGTTGTIITGSIMQ
ncbi:hypothetical protein PT276_08615 [Orbaceae bacterium ESL0721]|nr:hypothetical protein [Orbaceae bacterium ESL0721]